MRVGVRWVWVAAWVGLSVAFALAAGRYPWPIDPKRVGADLNAVSALPPGAHWERPAKATLTLLPWPILHIVDVELREATGDAILSAPGLDISLEPEHLMLGQISPAMGRLTNPRITVDLDALGVGEISRPTLGSVVLSGGVVKIVSASRGLDTTVENVDGRFEWTKATRPFSFAFAAMWRGQRVAGSGQIDSPLELAEGASTGARLTVASPDADFTFAGSWSRRENNAFDGDLTASVRARDSLRRWIGLRTPPLIDAQRFAFHGRVTGTSGSLLLRDASMEIGEQSFEGSISISKEGEKIFASGTLAADNLTLESLIGPRPALFDADGDWSRATLLPAANEALDLDLRVSAAHASWNSPAIDDVAVSVLRRDGRFTLKLLEASAYHGALTGEISLADTGGRPATRAALALDDADCGAMLQDWGVPFYSGRCALNADLSASGASPADIAASAKGSVRIELQAGAVAGINFEEALRRSLRRPIDIARDMIAGQTKFAEASAKVEIAGGEARIVEATAEGPGAIFEASGALGLVAREWRLKILATQATGLGTATADSARLGFTLSGPWAAPTLAKIGED